MKEKMIWLEYLRAIACIMVIVIHVSSEFILKGNLGTNWNLANIFDSFSRVSVPIFFMISGYLFFGEKQVSKKNYIKVITALLFYSCIAILTKLVVSFIAPNLASKLPLYYNFIAQPSIYHLWYFYPLIIIYMISNLVNIREIKFLTGLSIISVFFILFNPRLNDLLNFFSYGRFENYFSIQSDTLYFILYAILGGCFNNLKTFNPFLGKIGLLSYFVLSILVATLTWLTSDDKSFPYYNYTGILVFLMSLSIFSGFYSLQNRLVNLSFISLVSKHSLGIYGIHAFIVSGLSVITKFYNYPFVIAFPIIVFLVFFTSLTFSILLKKIDTKGYVS